MWFGKAAERGYAHAVPRFMHALHYRALREWESRYYAFDDRQVRVFDVGGAPYIVDADVFASIGVDRVARARGVLKRARRAGEYTRIPGSREWVFSEAGLLRYLANRQDARAAKFGLWVKREVYFPWYRRREHPTPGR
jgi:hypothetical protein